MPLEITENNACQHGKGTCFRAGDTRANALPQLTVMHTLWMREHNRVAKELAYLNSHWNDEHIFLEAKKIVTACIQHITYNEWLPTLLGVKYTKENGLGLLEDGYSNTYDETADPTVSNSFATAILPFANSMISEKIRFGITMNIIIVISAFYTGNLFRGNDSKKFNHRCSKMFLWKI